MSLGAAPVEALAGTCTRKHLQALSAARLEPTSEAARLVLAPVPFLAVAGCTMTDHLTKARGMSSPDLVVCPTRGRRCAVGLQARGPGAEDRGVDKTEATVSGGARCSSLGFATATGHHGKEPTLKVSSPPNPKGQGYLRSAQVRTEARGCTIVCILRIYRIGGAKITSR